MKKIFSLAALTFSLSILNGAFAQTSVTAGPEQKIKSEMKIPAAVRPGSEFTVEITITKGSTSGLARFQQYLAKGMTATSMTNDGAEFSFENQNLKFIWFALPLQETLNLKYKISVDASLNSSKTLSGIFSYVENGRTKTHSLVPKEIKIDPKAIEEEVASTETKRTIEPPNGEAVPVMVEVPKEEPEAKPEEAKAQETTTPAETTSNSNPVVETKSVSATEEKPKQAETENAVKKIRENASANTTPVAPALTSSATTSSSASGIVFRVQIAAMNEKRFRKDGHFQGKFGITQTVYTEEHDGLKKYTVGNCATYNEARALRDEISGSANGSFVVAYKDGVRISVTEAIEALKR